MIGCCYREMIVKFTFSEKSIKSAIDEIKAYKKWLSDKSHEFLLALAEVGMECAEANIQGFDGISFEIRDEGDCVLLVGMSEKQTRTWFNKKGQIVNNDYSPIFMAEFGSGIYAVEGHRGTFPTDTKHGLKDRWSYRLTPNGKPIKTSGEPPTRPMLRASQEMESKVKEVAKKVFGNV